MKTRKPAGALHSCTPLLNELSNLPALRVSLWCAPARLSVLEATSLRMDAITSAATLEDLSKKVRKPYTITKSRESWTEQEHDKFLEALQLFDRDWKKIESFVGSKSVIQIRSHAQKYFLKVQKNGTGEHVPPPRPKRKSAQPYPQKAVKTEPAYTAVHESCAVTPVASGSLVPSWDHHMAAPENVGSTHKKGMPDFNEVYSFLGSVFDPMTNGHLNKMQEMAPIDRETVVLLMRNLSLNLSSVDCERRKVFLSVCDMESQNTWPGAEVHKRLSDASVSVQSSVLAAMS